MAMNCQSESVVRLCVRYAEQLSVFEEFTVLDILGDISVDQFQTVHYIILVKIQTTCVARKCAGCTNNN